MFSLKNLSIRRGTLPFLRNVLSHSLCGPLMLWRSRCSLQVNPLEGLTTEFSIDAPLSLQMLLFNLAQTLIPRHSGHIHRRACLNLFMLSLQLLYSSHRVSYEPTTWMVHNRFFCTGEVLFRGHGRHGMILELSDLTLWSYW